MQRIQIALTAMALIVAAFIAAPKPAAASGESREMQAAIRFYERGDDMQAMDRFMDILTKGDPSERSMANEYINLITRRMNGSVATASPAPASSASATASVPKSSPSPTLAAVPEAAPSPAPSSPEPPTAPGSRASRPQTLSFWAASSASAPQTAASSAPAPKSEPTPKPVPVSKSTPIPKPTREKKAPVVASAPLKPVFDARLMNTEVKQRLKVAQDRSLNDLRAVDGVHVNAGAKGEPAAIGIPAALLFQSGISFRRDAPHILNPLTRLIFASGGAQVMILPEGTASGEAKVLDMRRVMGILTALFEAGVAPPRVRVNLLNNQVDIPRDLRDFKGILVVFVYGRPLSLGAESSVGEEQGPPVSLGVFPSRLRPSRNEGAIIEFSILEPRAGIASWKFQLLKPAADGMEPVPLQEVTGKGPAFHQIFWNGRKDYFGEPLPAGRYECVLSARDSKGRTRVLRRWIELLADSKSPEKAALAVGAPTEDLSEKLPKVLVKAKPKRRAASRRKHSKKTAKTKVPVAPASHYELAFGPNSYQMTTGAENALSKAASALSRGAYGSIAVIGHASADENDPPTLAQQRAKMVSGLLINRYQIAPDKIQVSNDAPSARAAVELTLSRNGP